MTDPNFFNFLEGMAKNKDVSNLEWEALRQTIEGKSSKEIADGLGITEDAVRKRLTEVYRKFHITGKGSGKLPQLQQIAFYEYQKYLPTRDSRSPAAGNDWNEAPDVDVFYGREKEKAYLKKWIVKERCRVVTIYGLGGIGKTSLAVKLAKEIESEFDYVIWRSLRHAPLLEDVLIGIDLLQSYLLEKSVDKIAALMEFFRNHRCLLILDEWEEVLASEALAGDYREGYDNYRELLRRVGESKHQSCLLLTSREKPREIGIYEGKKSPVKSLQIDGLETTDAENILRDKGLLKEPEWERLIYLYAGNPLGLKIVGAMIKEVPFDGSTSLFFKYATSIVSGEINYIVHKQFKRLSPLEKEIMKWLVNQQKPVSVSEILDAINSEEPKEKLGNALISLGRLSLLEKVKGEKEQTTFELQPVVKEYVKSIGS